MSITILPCPFCGFADVEICEVEPGRIAIDCPECECIGPFGDSVEEAAELWNVPTARFNDQAHGEARASSRLSPGTTGSTPATNGER